MNSRTGFNFISALSTSYFRSGLSGVWTRIPADSCGFLRILADSCGFLRILADSRGFSTSALAWCYFRVDLPLPVWSLWSFSWGEGVVGEGGGGVGGGGAIAIINHIENINIARI